MLRGAIQYIMSSSKNNPNSYAGTKYIHKNKQMSDEAGLSPLRASVKMKKYGLRRGREGGIDCKPILCTAVMVDTCYPV